MAEKHVHCPVNGWDCPHYKDSPFPCICTLDNPLEECDDFVAMNGDDEDIYCTEEH